MPFNRGSIATKAARNTCAVFGNGAIADRITRDWIPLSQKRQGNILGTIWMYNCSWIDIYHIRVWGVAKRTPCGDYKVQQLSLLISKEAEES
ncbi:hypothetical protein RB195_002509 [Necator americanus]|uniref:Uncharacterized protein n=1 Tax=Necator americanus TaxID=51031 RepID=A0ABR1DKB7_NECAM